jgi:starch synthase
VPLRRLHFCVAHPFQVVPAGAKRRESEQMSRILMVASEATPFIKTGGLADVIGSLPPALAERGEDVAVVLPWYRHAKVEDSRCVLEHLPLWLGKSCYPVRLHLSVVRDVPYYLVDCPALFDRDAVYLDEDGGFADNHVRFGVLSRAALAVARWMFRPRIIHCHDWQAALVPVYVRSALAGDPTFMGVKILLTIHNLAYQGLFPSSALGQLGLDPGVFHIGGLEFHGQVSFLKGGISYSDAVSTVSKAYSAEIQTPEYGCGLDGVLRARGGALAGILNGADYSHWDPATDPHLAAHYSAENLAGKRTCKLDLLTEFGLPAGALERPLIGIVSRFDSQKGFDLVEEIASELASEDLSLVALGTGELRYERFFEDLAAAHPGRIAVRVAYDDVLAHKIEAGSDMFLMPSRYEPCGLNQIYSLRYGSVPVVRATGGLDDTIDETTGFKFKEYSGQALLAAVRSALAAFDDRGRWRRLMLNGMAKDYSWKTSAAEYSALYRSLALES